MEQETARQHIERFLDSDVGHPTLGLVYGRRRIGKSTLLDDVTSNRSGFYWEATRGEAPVHLALLGAALGRHLGTGRLSLETWDEAVLQLLRLGEGGAVPVVLDEVGYLLESEPALDSILATALGPPTPWPIPSSSSTMRSSSPTAPCCETGTHVASGRSGSPPGSTPGSVDRSSRSSPATGFAGMPRRRRSAAPSGTWALRR